jgi:hypothetical protein
MRKGFDSLSVMAQEVLKQDPFAGHLYVEERIPVRAVASETCHVDRHDQADLVESDTSDRLLEAVALRGPCSAEAKIRIDDVDANLAPAELLGAPLERVLQSQALLICHDLMSGRLPDVHDRPPRQVRRLDQLGLHGLPPPGPRRPRRRSGPAAPSATWPTGLLDRSASSCSTSEIRS